MKHLLMLLALFAAPAFATNHTAVDQWGHLAFHAEQMWYWLGQGQWVLAFYQASCAQDALSQLLFVHGGLLWLLAIGLMVTMFVAYKLSMRLIRWTGVRYL